MFPDENTNEDFGDDESLFSLSECDDTDDKELSESEDTDSLDITETETYFQSMSKDDTITLRKHQQELFEQSLNENLIVCLPTNTGKTFIAVFLLRAKLNQTFGIYPQTARRSIFLAPTKELVKQQYSVIKEHIPAKCGYLTGDFNVDNFTLDKWNEFFCQHNIIVFTPEILSRLLSSNYVNFKNINVIIFDECHWILCKNSKTGYSNHPYYTIMKLYREHFKQISIEDRPRILALTATIFNGNPKATTLDDTICKLKQVYHANASSRDVSYFYKKPEVIVIQYKKTDLFNQSPIAIDELDDKDYNNFLRKLNDVLINMGPWFAFKLLHQFKAQLSLKMAVELKVIKQKVDNVDVYFKKIYGQFDERTLTFEMINDRIKIILLIMKEMKNSFNCLLFVKERIDAQLIKEYLTFISLEYEEEYGFIKAGFICGGNNTWFRIQPSVKNFKEKFQNGLLNVLVATSVVEEGIDVPISNLVIRYDFPESYRAYIQSKGRARDIHSLYILFINETEEEKYSDLLKLYNNIDKQMEQLIESVKENKSNDLSLIDDNIKEDDDEVYTTIKGARLYRSTALCLLNQFLSLLYMNDPFSNHLPSFVELNTKIIPRKDNPCEMITLRSYMFIFPIHSPCQGVVKSKYFTTKSKAKQDCAFKACIMLHKAELIDDNLGIVKPKMIVKKHAEELNLKIAFNNGALKKKKLYKPKTSLLDCFNFLVLERRLSVIRKCIQPNQTNRSFKNENIFYLYIINFECIQNSDVHTCPLQSQVNINCRRHPLTASKKNASQSPMFSLGIACSVCLPNKVNSSQISSIIFCKNVLFKFTVKFQEKFKFNDQQLKHIFVFHDHVMKLLRMYKDKDFSINVHSTKSMRKFNYYLLPFLELNNQFKTDFNLLSQMYDYLLLFEKFSQLKTRNIEEGILNEMNKCFNENTLKLFTNSFDYDQELMKQAIWTSFHKKDLTLVWIQNISNQMTDDKLHNSNETFIQFYQRMYGVQVAGGQRMCHVGYVHSQLKEFQMIQQESIRKNNKIKMEQKHYPVDFLVPYPLTASMFRTIAAFPLVFFRLHQFFVSYSLLEMLSQEIDSLDLDFEDIDITTLFHVSKTNHLVEQDVERLKLIQFKDIEELFDDNIVPDYKTSIKQDCSTSEQVILEEIKLDYGETSLFKFTGSISPFIRIHFDTFNAIKCPNPWHITKALTLAKVFDLWNMEKMETVGDSFLKMSTALYLFFAYWTYDEGKLQILKDSIVCNENLYKLAAEKKLYRFIFNQPFKNFNSIAFHSNLSNMDKIKAQKSNQVISQKQIADTVEAIIGTFVVHGSLGMAIEFMKWLGLKTFDLEFAKQKLSQFDPVNNYKHLLDSIQSDLSSPDDTMIFNKLFEKDLNKIVTQIFEDEFLFQVEKILDYKFKNKYFLVQALTHSSNLKKGSKYNLITSYERLETIGDSILDYMVTYYIYMNNQTLDPKHLSNLRSALVNNVFLASIAVKFNLHKYIRCSSNIALCSAINDFIRKYKNIRLRKISYLFTSNKQSSKEASSLSDEQKIKMEHQFVGDDAEADDDCDVIDEIDVPKVLADVVEALIGALFLDNELSIDGVWKIIFPLFKPELDILVQNIPLNHKFYLEQKYPQQIIFSDLQIYDPKQHKKEIKLRIPGIDKEFFGYGRNRAQCQNSAAKNAVKYLEKLGLLVP